MAKDRDDRYASATEMLADLNALLDDPTHSTERAKITGPRRRMPRPKIPQHRVGDRWHRASLVAAVTIGSSMLKGSKAKKQRRRSQCRSAAQRRGRGDGRGAARADAPPSTRDEAR